MCWTPFYVFGDQSIFGYQVPYGPTRQLVSGWSVFPENVRSIAPLTEGAGERERECERVLHSQLCVSLLKIIMFFLISNKNDSE